MTEQSKDESASAPQQSESEVIVLLKRMQQQLTYLERKIDNLANQSQERPSFREKSFSKPFRPFNRPHGPGHFHGKRDRNERSRERDPRSEQPFEKRHGSEDRGFEAPHKKFSDHRESGPRQDRPFKKEYGGKKKAFDPKKKPFYLNRKHH